MVSPLFTALAMIACGRVDCRPLPRSRAGAPGPRA